MLHEHYYLEERKQIRNMPEIIFAGLLKGCDEWMNKVHVHNFCEIIYVVDGHGRVMIDNKKFAFCKGDIIVYNSGSSHLEEIANDGVFLLFFALQNVTIPGMPEGHIVPEGKIPILKNVENNVLIKTLLGQMVEDLQEKPDYYQFVASNIANIIYLYLLRIFNVSSKVFSPQSVGAEAKRYIEENYSEDIKIDDLAYIFRFSKFYLTHAFKEEIGMPPIKYLTSVRLDQAKKMLANTENSINEIACKVGYPDAQCFARVFRNIENMTPSQYRKNIQNYR